MLQFQLPPPDVTPSGVSSQMNKFEQVYSDYHQMSLAGSPGLMSKGKRVAYLTFAGGGDTLPHDLSHDAFDVA